MTIEYLSVSSDQLSKFAEDKSSWPRGEWDDEPDVVRLIVDGYECMICRNPGGSQNGYICIPEGHPWFGKSYDDIGCDVHGGLTYGGSMPPNGVADPKSNWFGFDTAHCWDYAPKFCRFDHNEGKLLRREYRGVAYVTQQLEGLAAQAHAATQPKPEPIVDPADDRSIEDWQQEVANNQTLLGFAEWRAHKEG